MKNTLTVLLLIPVLGFSQHTSGDLPPTIPSMKYSWVTPSKKQQRNIQTTNILQGTGHNMAYVAVDASSISPSKTKTNLQVPGDQEHLIIIKSGTLMISFRDSSWSLGPGSIALLLPGEKFSVQTAGKEGCLYYLMRYRSNAPSDVVRGKDSGGSFVRDWKNLSFRAHERGGVRSYFEKSTAMSKRFEMHVTTLKPGLKSHDPHTHNAEEIILMLEDTPEGTCRTEMLIGDKSFQGQAGDLYYVGSNLLHGIKNIGTTTCSYFAFQFE